MRRAVAESLESRTLLTAVFWDGDAGNGLWNSANNWSNNAVPTAADDVTIDLAGTYTVTLSGTAASINTLALGAASGIQTLAMSTNLTLAAACTVNAQGVVLQSAGTLGGTGDLDISGSMTWTGGTMSGSGTTLIASGGTLNIASTVTLSRILQTERIDQNNFGAVNWTGGAFSFGGGTVNNNGSFTANSNVTLDAYDSSGANAFNNNAGGSFIKQGSGTTQFRLAAGSGVSFNNNGTVDVQAGTLYLASGGTHGAGATCSFAVASTLQFGGTHTLSGASLGGSGMASVVGGTTTFGGATTGTGTLTVGVAGGTLNIDGSATFSGGLSMSVGVLGGSGTVSFGGVSSWTGGTMSGTGTTIIASGGTLNITNTVTLSRILQNNFGAVNWTGGNWSFGGGTVNNNGTFTANSSGLLDAYDSSGTNVFNNNAGGSFIKQGSGTTQFRVGAATGVSFNNNGTVDVQGGTLMLSSGGIHSSGSFAGPGTVSLGGAFAWTGGTMTGTGSTTIESAATLNISGAGAKTSTRHLQVNGQATLAAGADKVLVTASLGMGAGARLDLNDNAFIVDYTGTTPVDTIRGYLASGYSGGAWNGAGIKSSAAAATANRSLGFAEATDLFSTFPAIFAGQSIDNTAVLVRYTVSGDVNLDHLVDITDLGILATNWQQSPRRWSQGNFNFDQQVDITDLGILATNWQKNLAQPSQPSRVTPSSRSPARSAMGSPFSLRRMAPATLRQSLANSIELVGIEDL